MIQGDLGIGMGRWAECLSQTRNFAKARFSEIQRRDRTIIFILDELMAHNKAVEDIEKIVIYGYCTDICVISNAMVLRAAFPETEIEVLSDCCAGVTPQSHQTALDAMRACQFTII